MFLILVMGSSVTNQFWCVSTYPGGVPVDAVQYPQHMLAGVDGDELQEHLSGSLSQLLG